MSESLSSLLALAESFHYPSGTQRGLKNQCKIVSPHIKKHHNPPVVGPFQIQSKVVAALPVTLSQQPGQSLDNCHCLFALLVGIFLPWLSSPILFSLSLQAPHHEKGP